MSDRNKMVLGKQAKALGFVRDTYEKVCRLTDVLKYFEDDNMLGKTLALKGGTAINLTIFDLPRLSVDIDLDYSENSSREDMLAARSTITDRLEKYMTANGYSLSPKSKHYHALDSFVFEYRNSTDMRDNMKVEINYMLRCHVLETSRRRFETAWEPAGVSVLSLAPIEIFAGKIVALLNRTAPRDLYDIHNLVNQDALDKSDKTLLRKCVVFYSAIGSESPPFEFPLSNIDRVTKQRIKTDLTPVLRSKANFDFASAQSQVKLWLEDLLMIEDKERAFLEAFRSNEYRPDLLFDSDEILARIKNHPMARWKCYK